MKTVLHTPAFGIYDTKDQCWMGNENGPVTYDTMLLACAAATIINEQFRNSRGPFRFRARVIPADVFQHKDKIDAPMTFTEALDSIEKRAK